MTSCTLRTEEGTLLLLVSSGLLAYEADTPWPHNDPARLLKG